MKIIVKNSYDEVGKEAFKELKKVLLKKTNAVIGLATGSSPLGLYKEMIADYRNGGISYSDVTCVNLDEYVGLDKKHDQSYAYFMRENLFKHIDVKVAKTNIENGKAKNLEKECERYNELLQKYRQDVQILGIGSNGHIAFNEPGTKFDSVTHVVELKQGTREDNARFFDSIDDVPTHALTMGIKNILNAKKIIVVATGRNKAKAVKAMIKNRPSIKCPASALQSHKNVVIILDKEAASLL